MSRLSFRLVSARMNALVLSTFDSLKSSSRAPASTPDLPFIAALIVAEAGHLTFAFAAFDSRTFPSGHVEGSNGTVKRACVKCRLGLGSEHAGTNGLGGAL